MSPRHHPSRAVVLLLALLSMVALGDSQRETCAMHGSGSALAEMSGGMHVAKMQGVATHGGTMHGVAGEGDAGTSADVAEHHAHARSNGGSDEQDSHHCGCTCLGDCSVSAP